MRRIYRAIGPDHYGHALNFAVSAAHILFPDLRVNRYNFEKVDMPKQIPKEDPWYIKDFNKRVEMFSGRDSIIIKPDGKLIEPQEIFPREGI